MLGGKLNFKKKSNKTEEVEGTWKIVIADDEMEVHKITKMILENQIFEKKHIEFISAYSGEETKKIMRENEDIALILLDVVMEEEDSGLQVVKYIRNELKNRKVRIILRTGQPGQAPESKVALEYDINDYKEKTELTSQKLSTVIYSTLRSYRDIDDLDKTKKGLERIIKASAVIYSSEMEPAFYNELIGSITQILNVPLDKLGNYEIIFATRKDSNYFQILACAGNNYKHSNLLLEKKMIKEDEIKVNMQVENEYIEIFQTNNGNEYLVLVKRKEKFSNIEKYFMKIYIYIMISGIENFELIEKHGKLLKEVIFEREKSELAMKVKQEFIQNISHELRTPLSGIIGNLDLLALSQDKEVSQSIRAIETSAERMRNMVEKLLAFKILD